MKSNLTTSGFFQQLVNLDACCPAGVVSKLEKKLKNMQKNWKEKDLNAKGLINNGIYFLAVCV